jgi:DMSO/TMAO reductase YedYZ molybdopterin-dependent catalytic subunit
MGSAGLCAQARWRGVSFETLLDACGGPGPSTHFGFHGLDPMWPLRPGYHYGLSLKELVRSRALVAFEMNGEPLPRPRGFPVRLVVPGIYSMSHVKWLGRIVGETAPHRSIWNQWVFTNQERQDGRWKRVQARWIGLKSLLTRCRRQTDGWELAGWAWGGDSPVTRVEVTTDGGKTWRDAEVRRPDEFFPDDPVKPEDHRDAWSTFHFQWSPPGPGTYLLATRAWAEDGSSQPMEDDPDVKGHFNVTKVKWRRVRVPG